MATAVDDSARPPPSTMAAGPDAPSTAIIVYATSASVATTCAPGCPVARGAAARMACKQAHLLLKHLQRSADFALDALNVTREKLSL